MIRHHSQTALWPDGRKARETDDDIEENTPLDDFFEGSRDGKGGTEYIRTDAMEIDLIARFFFCDGQQMNVFLEI